MKKTSVSILVLLAVVICGCTNTSKKKKNSKEEGVSTTSSNNSSETSFPGQSSTQVISSTSAISSQAPSETPPPPAGTEVTRTIATCLDPFETGTGFAASRQIDNHDNEQSADKVQNAAILTSYFSSICDVEGMISSLTYTTLNTNVDRNNGNDVYLTIGTTCAGSIVWQSTAQMKKVVLHVNNYHKWYRDYQTETEEQWHTAVECRNCCKRHRETAVGR